MGAGGLARREPVGCVLARTVNIRSNQRCVPARTLRSLQPEGFAHHLVGNFISDTGPLHQLIHIWRFEDDAARRDFWKRLYASDGFMGFAVQVRPLLAEL